MSEHRIHISEVEAGNMGAKVAAFRAFCSCGWSMDYRVKDPSQVNRLVQAHLRGRMRAGNDARTTTLLTDTEKHDDT